MLAQRKADLEAKEAQIRAKKLATAASVKAWKNESKKTQIDRDEKYRTQKKQDFLRRVGD